MKYLQTKHERNSAKITTLIMLILTLLLFVVGQNYQEQPEEYGVAINFNSSALGGENEQPNKSEVVEKVVEEDLIEEETNPEKTIEEKEIEEETAEESKEAEKKALETEKILREEAELAAEKLKSEKEAKLKAETERKEKEAKVLKEAKENAEKVAKAKSESEAKIKSEAKAKADAKARADAEAKAAAVAAKKENEGTGETPFALIENAPIYPGCEDGNNAERKECMNEKIKAFISENFDTDLASDLTGIQKINITFKINTSGHVVSVNANASDPKLIEEAKRVTKLLPRMKPGIQQGKAVVVSYGLPIRIKLEN